MAASLPKKSLSGREMIMEELARANPDWNTYGQLLDEIWALSLVLDDKRTAAKAKPVLQRLNEDRLGQLHAMFVNRRPRHKNNDDLEIRVNVVFVCEDGDFYHFFLPKKQLPWTFAEVEFLSLYHPSFVMAWFKSQNLGSTDEQYSTWNPELGELWIVKHNESDDC
jgi:hypothetical protein